MLPCPVSVWAHHLPLTGERLVNLAREHMEALLHLVIFPGLAISFAVLASHLFGDGLRDILDPRLGER